MNINGLLQRESDYIASEQYETAYELLKSAYDEHKENPEFLEHIALLAKTLEKQDEAAKYWEELVVVNPNSIVAYSELLDIYDGSNKYKYYITRAKYKILNEKISQSIDDYKKAINSTTEEEEIVNARFLLAKAYEHENRTQNAIDEYFRIVETRDDLGIFLKLADLYCELDDRYSAINILERGVKVYSDDVTLCEYLTKLYIKEGQFEKAVQYAKNEFSKIKAYLMNGNNDLAFELLEKVEDKKNANYPALMAEYYFNLQNFEKCSEYIEQFRELSPQNPLVYQMKALVADANNDSFGYHYNMGRCYSFKQDYEVALVEYLNAHRVDANRSEAIKEIIKINEASGEKTSLMEFYEKLVRQEPDNIVALKGLGDIYADMYEFSSAIDYYEKLLKVAPNEYVAYYKIGLCYEKTKRIGAAKEAYEKYLSKAPLSPDTEKLKEKVEKMVIGSNEVAGNEEEGFIDKIMRFFTKK